MREDRPMKTVWIYIDTQYIAGDPRHLKAFATFEAANDWFEQYDPEGWHLNIRSSVTQSQCRACIE